MNTLRRRFLAVVLGLASSSLLIAGQPKVGDSFPKMADFKFDGPVPDFAGKVVLVDFWASWCGPCRHSFPALQELHEKFKDQGVIVLGVSLDEDRADMDGFLKKAKISFATVRDPRGKLAEKLDVNSIPASFLLDKTGKIVAIHNGYEGDKTKREYMAEVEKLVSAK